MMNVMMLIDVRLYVKCDFEILLFLWGVSCQWWFFGDFNLMV